MSRLKKYFKNEKKYLKMFKTIKVLFTLHFNRKKMLKVYAVLSEIKKIHFVCFSLEKKFSRTFHDIEQYFLNRERALDKICTICTMIRLKKQYFLHSSWHLLELSL